MLTPGVNLDTTDDQLGQQYITAKVAIEGGSDIIIVGRGIYGQKNPKHAAIQYREQAWSSWEKHQFEKSKG